MLAAFGVCAALVERNNSGRGQVVDAAIVDGTGALMAMMWSNLAQGSWRDERGVNLLDGGVPWYDVYETSDHGWMAVGALEPAFYEALLTALELPRAPTREDPDNWPELRRLFSARFAEHTRKHWTTVFEGSDACVEPVLSLAEASRDAHLMTRGTYLEKAGMVSPGRHRDSRELRGPSRCRLRCQEPTLSPCSSSGGSTMQPNSWPAEPLFKRDDAKPRHLGGAVRARSARRTHA